MNLRSLEHSRLSKHDNKKSSIFIIRFNSFIEYLYSSADIDECADGSSQCDAKSTDCSNLSPGYQCNCKSGFLPISGDIYKCKGKLLSTNWVSI